MARALKLLAVITVLAVQVCFAFSSYESGMMNTTRQVRFPLRLDFGPI
jgi:hypothetical protein